MTDHPVLIPTDEGPVGGVVSEPEEDARAALLLFPGGGRPARSGIDSLWTRIARDLAGMGITVLRVDQSREGETLPIGEGESGPQAKHDMDLRLMLQTLAWFRARLRGLDLTLAGHCSGARAAIELAGRHPASVAGTLLITPYLRVTPREGAAAGDSGDPDAVDDSVVDRIRAVLAHAPSRILIGERDDLAIPRLQRLLGPTPRPLEVEVVPDVSLHLLDHPDLQREVRNRLLEFVVNVPRSSPAAAS